MIQLIAYNSPIIISCRIIPLEATVTRFLGEHLQFHRIVNFKNSKYVYTILVPFSPVKLNTYELSMQFRPFIQSITSNKRYKSPPYTERDKTRFDPRRKILRPVYISLHRKLHDPTSDNLQRACTVQNFSSEKHKILFSTFPCQRAPFIPILPAGDHIGQHFTVPLSINI